MEEDFDLRGYIEVLLKRWKWIAGVAVTAALTGLLVSMLTAPTYEAATLVFISEPRYQMELDPRFDTAEGLLADYEVLPILATSNDVLQEVVDRYIPADVAPEAWTPHALSGMVQVTSLGEPSMVLLRVGYRSAEGAAAIANVWAEVLADRGNELYGLGEDDVEFFEEQAADAQASLDEAETALVEFQGRNQARILEAGLASYAQTQSDCLAHQRDIAYLLQDIEGLRDQLREQPAGSPPTLGDALTAWLLQVKAFNADALVAIELQVDSAESLSGRSVSEQISSLEGLIAVLEAKSAEIEGRLVQLVSPVLELQRELQLIEAEEAALTRARELAGEQYIVLARKLEEARLAASQQARVVQVASYAAVPLAPAGQSRLLRAGLAGVLGLMGGIFGVLAIYWWRAGSDKPGSPGRRGG